MANPPAPVEQPPAGEDPALPTPDQLAVGKQGFFKPSALLQFWLTTRWQDDTTSYGFRLRRAEVKVQGSIIPDHVEYGLMFDLAKVLKVSEQTVPVENQEPEPTTPGDVTVPSPATDYSPLQDFYITFPTSIADVSVGQFKVPVGYESITSSSKLWLPERALVITTFADVRDIGVRAQKNFGPFAYQAGVFNGAGANAAETNRQKDLALRLELSPVEGLAFGTSGRVAVGQRNEPTTRDRLGGDARWEKSGVLLQAEYLRAWTGAANATRSIGHGFYALGGYTFVQKLQPVLRIGMLNRDVEVGKDKTWHYEAGLNYYWLENQARFGLSGSYFDNEDGGTADSFDLILLAQASF